MPRPLSWRDLLLLHHYRRRAACLRSRERLIGQDNLPIHALTGLLAHTAVVDESHTPPLLALADPAPPDHPAWLLYLAPEDALTATTPLAGLLKALLRQPALAGKPALLAEAPLSAPWLPALRAGGLRIFAHRQIWRLPPAGAVSPSTTFGEWRWPHPQERWQADRLYTNLTPPTTRRLLPPPAHAPTAIVYVAQGELCGLATWVNGPRGVWAAVWLDPNTAAPHRALSALAAFLRPGRKPLYLAVHDTQSWLAGSLKALGAQPGLHTALLARWTVVFQPETRPHPATAGEATPAFFAQLHRLHAKPSGKTAASPPGTLVRKV